MTWPPFIVEIERARERPSVGGQGAGGERGGLASFYSNQERESGGGWWKRLVEVLGP